MSVIELLTQHKIIRYATYKSQYILFEGTDVNIEGELLKAAGIVPRSKDIVEKLITNFNFPIEFANASYYRKGTPRYFKYEITDHPIILQPQNEIDGYINLIFNEDLTVDALKQHSVGVEEAILCRLSTRRLTVFLRQVSKNSPPNRTYTSRRIRLSTNFFFSLNFSQMPQPVATRTQRNGLAFSG